MCRGFTSTENIHVCVGSALFLNRIMNCIIFEENGDLDSCIHVEENVTNVTNTRQALLPFMESKVELSYIYANMLAT